MIQFVPYNKETTAEELAKIIKSEIIKYFGIFKSCVLDRGSLFIFIWWAIFYYWWEIRRKLSTTFHPQTDGVTERQNQTLEIFLRYYTNYNQDDWARLLTII